MSNAVYFDKKDRFNVGHISIFDEYGTSFSYCNRLNKQLGKLGYQIYVKDRYIQANLYLLSSIMVNCFNLWRSLDLKNRKNENFSIFCDDLVQHII